MRKIDRTGVIAAYNANQPYTDIQRKFGVSYGYLLRILKDAGIKPDQARVRENGGYRKLVRAGKSKTRILSIPTRILTELDVNLDKNLTGKWLLPGEAVKGTKWLVLEIKEVN